MALPEDLVENPRKRSWPWLDESLSLRIEQPSCHPESRILLELFFHILEELLDSIIDAESKCDSQKELARMLYDWRGRRCQHPNRLSRIAAEHVEVNALNLSWRRAVLGRARTRSRCALGRKTRLGFG